MGITETLAGGNRMKKILLILLSILMIASNVVFAIGPEIDKINNTISQLERLRAEENKVSKSLIKEMASGLIELE